MRRKRKCHVICSAQFRLIDINIIECSIFSNVWIGRAYRYSGLIRALRMIAEETLRFLLEYTEFCLEDTMDESKYVCEVWGKQEWFIMTGESWTKLLKNCENCQKTRSGRGEDNEGIFNTGLQNHREHEDGTT